MRRFTSPFHVYPQILNILNKNFVSIRREFSSMISARISPIREAVNNKDRMNNSSLNCELDRIKNSSFLREDSDSESIKNGFNFNWIEVQQDACRDKGRFPQ